MVSMHANFDTIMLVLRRSFSDGEPNPSEERTHRKMTLLTILVICSTS